MQLYKSLLFPLALLALTASAAAEVKLPAIFGDNMVIQRGKPFVIWGTAEPGEMVHVSWVGELGGDGVGEKDAFSDEKGAKAGADGRWQLTMGTAKGAGGPIQLAVKGKSNVIDLKNVLVGEVWVCSGQSNMAWTLRQADGADKEIAGSTKPTIRLITVPRVPVDKPQTDFKGKWEACSPETVASFSAVAYFFGRDLQQHLNVPIGLINTSYGGTPAEAWTSRAALEGEASLKPLLENWDKRVQEESPEKITKQNQDALKKWQDAAAKAKADGKPAPARPRPIAEARRSQNRPANLYNGMIAPLAPLSVRGAIWYQGESNVPRAHQYRTLFPLMIADWRKAFGQPELPFLFVQLAPFRYDRHASPQFGAELWEAQLNTLKTVPNTGMAVITDIGNTKDIHPTNKHDVGKRLALWARATVYGEKGLVYSGPIYKAAKADDDAIVVSFDHIGGGLQSRDEEALTHFEVAGEDKVFKPAVATIEGNTLRVTSKDVAKPVAVRFAWRDDAEPNLVNKEGLPASPFRSDTWKSLTEGKAY